MSDQHAAAAASAWAAIAEDHRQRALAQWEAQRTGKTPGAATASPAGRDAVPPNRGRAQPADRLVALWAALATGMVLGLALARWLTPDTRTKGDPHAAR